MTKKSLLDGIFPHDDTATAQKKSERIIKHAIKEAHSILTQTTFFHKSLKESLKDELRIALDAGITLFRQELAIKTTLITEEFRKTIQHELRDVHDNLQKHAEQEMKQIEEDLIAYKKEKLMAMDSELTELLKNEIRETLKIELPEKIKQELLIKALERAKRNGFFSNT